MRNAKQIHRHGASCIWLLLVGGLIACTKTATRHDRNVDVSDSVTIARCHREVNCGRVGDGRRFSDTTQCRRAAANPMIAYMTGKLKISGDLNTAMELQKLIPE